MANDIFTGGASGDPIDWSVGTWSAGLPTATSVVEEHGAGIDDYLTSSGATQGEIGGLVLDSGSNLTVDANLTVTGLGDSVFGGAGSTLTIADEIMTVQAGVTSATGVVNIDTNSSYVYDGSGATQTINAMGSLYIGGSDNNDTITLSGNGISGDEGSGNGGTITFQDGYFVNYDLTSTTIMNMSSGGVFLSVPQFGGTIEHFDSNSFIGIVDQTSSGTSLGTATTDSIDQASHTITFDFSPPSGTAAYIWHFDPTTNLANVFVAHAGVSSGTAFAVIPLDVFSGAAHGGSTNWSSTSNWSAGATPASNYTVVEQSGAGTLNLHVGGSNGIGDLILNSGALLTILAGQALSVDGGDLSQGFGGANSVIDVAGELTAGYDVEAAAGQVNLTGGAYTFEGHASDQTVDMSGGGTFIDNVLTNSGGVVHNFNGVVENLGVGGFIGTEHGVSSFSFAPGTGGGPGALTVTDADNVTYSFSLSLAPGVTPSELALGSHDGSEVVEVVCFASGSRIKTTCGDVAVEDLAVADLAVTTTGEARPIVWIGHRRIDCPAPAHWPVRVMAGAFGEGRPARDLMLSPGHAVCVDVMGEVFVPVDHLINDLTIARVEAHEITYWHVELESHDVLLAEGLPCESYMDTGNRAFFGREYGRLQAVDPDRIAESLTRYARPFVTDPATVSAIRQRLAARAKALALAAGPAAASRMAG